MRVRYYCPVCGESTIRKHDDDYYEIGPKYPIGFICDTCKTEWPINCQYGEPIEHDTDENNE